MNAAGPLLLEWDGGRTDSGMLYRDVLEDLNMAECVGTVAQGQMVLILTATHYFLGKVVEANWEEYVLEEDSAIVYRTGNAETMLKSGQVDEMDRIPVRNRVRRGGIICVMDWPHKKLPTVAGGR